MKELVIVAPKCMEQEKQKRLEIVLSYNPKNIKTLLIENAKELLFHNLKNKRILFSIPLGESGVNLEYYSMLKAIRLNNDIFEGSIGGIIVDGKSELYTKSVSRELVLAANMSGCTFIGKPLVEGTKDLYNFNIIAMNLKTDNYTAFKESVKDLIERILSFENVGRSKKILALHSGDKKTSNSLTLWNLTKEHIKGDVADISLRNGELLDCKGCSYDVCLHFGEKGKCLYGGVITKEVYPAIVDCDALVMICPNYNDAVGANLTAFINRLTALFRAQNFSEKKLHAIIVSGYSGSDIVASQLVSSLNMNKSFILPANFALMERANNPGSILEVDKILEKAKSFGERI